MNRERESIVGCGGLEVECEFLIEVFVFHYKVKDVHDHNVLLLLLLLVEKRFSMGVFLIELCISTSLISLRHLLFSSKESVYTYTLLLLPLLLPLLKLLLVETLDKFLKRSSI